MLIEAYGKGDKADVSKFKLSKLKKPARLDELAQELREPQ